MLVAYIQLHTAKIPTERMNYLAPTRISQCGPDALAQAAPDSITELILFGNYCIYCKYFVFYFLLGFESLGYPPGTEGAKQLASLIKKFSKLERLVLPCLYYSVMKFTWIYLILQTYKP